MRELVPACPPGAVLSRTSTSSPSDAAYTAAPRPAGPAPTMTTSLTALASSSGDRPSAAARPSIDGFLRT